MHLQAVILFAQEKGKFFLHKLHRIFWIQYLNAKNHKKI